MASESPQPGPPPELPPELTLLTFGHHFPPYPACARVFSVRAFKSPKGALKGKNGLARELQDALLAVPGARERMAEICGFAERAARDPRGAVPAPDGSVSNDEMSAANSDADPESEVEPGRSPTPPSGTATPAPEESPLPPGPVVGIMCDHGRHRSVAMAELCRAELERRGVRVHVRHRDLGRGKTAKEREKTERRLAREREEAEGRGEGGVVDGLEAEADRIAVAEVADGQAPPDAPPNAANAANAAKPPLADDLEGLASPTPTDARPNEHHEQRQNGSAGAPGNGP